MGVNFEVTKKTGDTAKESKTSARFGRWEELTHPDSRPTTDFAAVINEDPRLSSQRAPMTSKLKQPRYSLFLALRAL